MAHTILVIVILFVIPLIIAYLVFRTWQGNERARKEYQETENRLYQLGIDLLVIGAELGMAKNSPKETSVSLKK